MKGFKLKNQLLQTIEIDNANIKNESNIIHLVDTASAFDPAHINKDTPYFHDTITIETILFPAEYINLTNFITNSTKLTLEYAINNLIVSFDVTCDKYPQMTDNGRFCVEKYTFVFKSIYSGSEEI